MEFKEVIGRRRSIRYFVPYRPVEREKIQTILEAARLASCAVNATFLRAIVVQRDDLAPEVLEGLKTPVSALNLELAPVYMYFYRRSADTPGVARQHTQGAHRGRSVESQPWRSARRFWLTGVWARMEASDAFMQQTTVHTWLASLQRHTQLTPPAHQE